MPCTVLSIQARLGSSRLPGKVFYPLGDRRVLGRVLDQTRHASTVDAVALTTGDRSENTAILDWASSEDVMAYQGPEENLVERHFEVIEHQYANTLVRVTADCPFIDPGEIDRVVNEHYSRDPEPDYTTNVTDGLPTGLAVDVLPHSTLKELRERGEQHPVTPLRAGDGGWDVKVSRSEKWTPFSGVKLAVDTPEDYRELCRAVGETDGTPEQVVAWLEASETGREHQDVFEQWLQSSP